MVETIMEWVAWYFSAWYGVLYWLPATICGIVYTLRSINDISDDRAAVKAFNAKMADYKSLEPEMQQEDRYGDISKGQMRKPYYDRTHRTIGYIFGRWFVCLVPVVNAFYAVFDCLGSIVEECVDFLRKAFNIDIIKKPEQD